MYSARYTTNVLPIYVNRLNMRTTQTEAGAGDISSQFTWRRALYHGIGGIASGTNTV